MRTVGPRFGKGRDFFGQVHDVRGLNQLVFDAFAEYGFDNLAPTQAFFHFDADFRGGFARGDGIGQGIEVKACCSLINDHALAGHGA